VDGGTTEQVRDKIVTALNMEQTIPTIEQLSAAMKFSPQTLRRRLHSEGSNLHDIKQQIRRDLAIYHLTQDTLSVEAIALAVGYTETSNFVRAFKLWTGLSPLQFRKRL